MAILTTRTAAGTKPNLKSIALSQWSEAELLDNVLRKQAIAWAELVRRYRALIYRCITKVTMRYSSRIGAADLDEIYADVMMQLVREDMHKLRLYNPERGTKLGSWLGMIAINAAYDFLRACTRRPMLDQGDGALTATIEAIDSDDQTASPLDQLLEKERWAHLNDLLTDFTDRDRTFVELYYRRGLEAEEIATEMNISLKTVYSKKHKIRAHLVRCLNQITGDSPISDLSEIAAA
jgi:RNA polymerase sigma-70 factor, ECF subfamily